MTVFRVEKTKDFTVMSNHHLRNRTLSLKAKGLLSLMQILIYKILKNKILIYLSIYLLWVRIIRPEVLNPI